MKVIRINDYNAPALLEDASTPEIGVDEVLVRVQAAALNPLDVKLQSGALREMMPLSFPYALGTDLAGTIERAGPLAEHWHEGDKVVARLDPAKGGAMAEFSCRPGGPARRWPTTVSTEEAAGVPTTGGTAWQALFQTARVMRGQTALVHAGAGGVGSLAVQFARLASARVIATASGDGIEVARRFGADRVIDYRSAQFWEQLVRRGRGARHGGRRNPAALVRGAAPGRHPGLDHLAARRGARQGPRRCRDFHVPPVGGRPPGCRTRTACRGQAEAAGGPQGRARRLRRRIPVSGVRPRPRQDCRRPRLMVVAVDPGADLPEWSRRGREDRADQRLGCIGRLRSTLDDGADEGCDGPLRLRSPDAISDSIRRRLHRVRLSPSA